ncbi:glutactin-like isoform X1 [Anopheles funestus]|uniref:glutactin-like isoform X1 n=2 Tax=Anopheles funestus TaxID=62324 RepID=UPI0020C68309|nr:glutactin-like isoform X1 [Anopheles funestus]
MFNYRAGIYLTNGMYRPGITFWPVCHYRHTSNVRGPLIHFLSSFIIPSCPFIALSNGHRHSGLAVREISSPVISKMLLAEVLRPAVLAVLYLATASSGITVRIQSLGEVIGSETVTARTEQLVYQFFNIPYAEAPTGTRRFKPPVPIASWNVAKDVSEPGRPCPQPGITDQLNPGDITPAIEDCLSLSVFTKNVTAKYPVMVYIHGGSFYLGKAADHPPNYLLERDVTLVAVQYRLGALGFLSTMSANIPGNAAMHDIVMALKWVQDHIGDFGGDPQRVTVFGQSAGAAATSALLYSPLVPPSYFSQVILQSGGSTAAWAIDPNPIDNAKDIAKYAGCDIVRPIEDVERCLQELPVLSLIRALDMHSQERMVNQGVYNIGGCGMVIGGPSGFLTEDPFNVMRSGQVRKDVRMMAGATKHDGSFMMTGLYDMLSSMELVNNNQFNQYDLIDTANRVFGIDEHGGALAGYEIETLFTEQELKSGNFSQLMAGLIDIAGTIVIKGPVLRDVQNNARYSDKETYLYSFDYQGEHTRFGYGANTSHYPFRGGAHHSDDNMYLFPYPASVTNLNSADRLMSEIMVDLWTSFAIDGVPKSSKGVPTWPKVNGPTGPYMHINEPFSIGSNFYDEYAVSAHERSAAYTIRQTYATVMVALSIVLSAFSIIYTLS